MELVTQIKNLMIDIVQNKTAMFAKDKAVHAEDAVRLKLVELFGSEKLSYNVWEEKKWRVFSIISEVLNVNIPSGIIRNPFFDSLADFRNGADGEQNEFVIEDDSILFVARVSGNHWNIDRQKLLGKRSFVVPTEWIGVRIYEELDRILKGVSTVADMFVKIQEGLEFDINNRILAAWGNASVFLPDEFKESGTFDKDAMLGLTDKLQAATGRGIRIIGTRQGLSKISDGLGLEWVSDDMRNERNRTGFIGNWEGIEVVALPQAFRRGTFDFAIDPNVIRIVPGDVRPIKIFYEGDSRIRSLDYTDNEDMTVETQTQTKMGVGVVMPMLFAEYTITT